MDSAGLTPDAAGVVRLPDEGQVRPSGTRVMTSNLAASAGQIRIARPTSRLDEVIAFYRDVLGLDVIDSFHDHDGFAGVMVGLPGSELHLEFTTREGDEAREVGLAPTQDNLLVFYIDGAGPFEVVTERIRRAGHAPVPCENPYWVMVGGLTFVDPDGWRVVVVPGRYES